MLDYTRLYTDKDGESHFEEAQTDLALTEYAPPAPPLLLSAFTPARQFGFMQAPAGWSSDWHPSSVRSMFFVLSGEGEVTASDGETRRFAVGSILLAEDTDGKGHRSKVVSDVDSLAAMLEL
jgi:mannose-6-phosphate isomerase-like protein (cupin superfamily)